MFDPSGSEAESETNDLFAEVIEEVVSAARKYAESNQEPENLDLSNQADVLSFIIIRHNGQFVIAAKHLSQKYGHI